MKNLILCCGILLLLGASCGNFISRAELTLKKGEYQIWDDKPFSYRACGGDSANMDSRLYFTRKIHKDTTIEIHSFLIDGENTFVHNRGLMWIRTPLPFSEEEVKYLRFLFPQNRKSTDCRAIYGSFFNGKRHKIYVNNCIVDLSVKKCTPIDMSIYQECFLNGKYILCKIKNSDKEENWNEDGEKQ